MAYAILAEGRSEEELEELDGQIGMNEGPVAQALAELRKHQETMGMTFDDPEAPVPPPLGSVDEEFR